MRKLLIFSMSFEYQYPAERPCRELLRINCEQDDQASKTASGFHNVPILWDFRFLRLMVLTNRRPEIVFLSNEIRNEYLTYVFCAISYHFQNYFFITSSRFL